MLIYIELVKGEQKCLVVKSLIDQNGAEKMHNFI